MTDQLTDDKRKKIIKCVSDLFIDHYMDLNMAHKIVDDLNGKLKNGDYDNVTQFARFGDILTEDLRNCSNDYHLLIYYDPQKSNDLIRMEKEQTAHDQYEDEWWLDLKFFNYGIQKLEYLQGNVGYINIQCFAPAPLAGHAVVNAMAFLAESDSLIIDLRECVGGDPFTVQLLESYLFDQRKKPTLLLTRYTRDEIPELQEWTYPYIPGKRLPNIPVFVLTSSSTFSGAEDMAYTLKHHGRAKVIGEQTGGGAHGVKWMRVGEGFVIVLPNSYPLHPETNSNWEGIGVEPDVKMPHEKALFTAHRLALQELLEGCASEDKKHQLNWSLDRVKAQYDPYELHESQLRKYTGEFRGWVITLNNGFLYLSQKGSIGVSKMIPISETLFTADAEYNIRFELGEDGYARGITWLSNENAREIFYNRDGV